MDENRSRDKGGVCKLQRSNPVSWWGAIQTAQGLPGLARTGRRGYGGHPQGRWGGGWELVAEPPPRLPWGRSATPGRGAVRRTVRGRGCHGASRGGVTRTPPGSPRGRRLQMVPGLPREPAASGRGRLLSSFRGAAVPPLAPARRHAPRRRRRPRALPAPRDSACPPPAVCPVAARNRPSWPGCGRGD